MGYIIIISFTYLIIIHFLPSLYRVVQKSVPEPSSSGAAYYSEVSIYPKVAAKVVSSVYPSIEFTQKIVILCLLFNFNNN